METKICTKCGRELPIDCFHWKNKAKGIKRSECKDCHNSYMNKHNSKNRQIIQELKQNQYCAKCGESRWYLLDYHHIDPDNKKDTVARLMVHSSQKAMKEEIEKCILLCANCHREFHYLQKENEITLEEYLNNSRP